MKCLKAGYIIDEHRRTELNCKGQNYWWSYIAEITGRMGLTAEPVSTNDFPRRLSEFSLLFLGESTQLPPLPGLFDWWVASGGVLIACNTAGLDRLFGNELLEAVSQTDGDFSINGELYLTRNQFTTEIHSLLFPDQPLLTASSMRLVSALKSEVIARINSKAGITARKYGKGWAFYFGFDLAQTFWVIQQGRPVDRDYDGDGYFRTGDATVIGDFEPAIGYTDELILLLQNMVAVQKFPMVYQLPPNGDTIPDVALFYGGDDEGSEGIQLPAAEFMHSRGLPYHINCMNVNGKFGITPDESDRLAEFGTETSLHYDFNTGFEHPCGYEKSDVEYQTKQFVEHFGKTPVCANMHCVRWTGWMEPALWLMQEGIKSTNVHIHVPAKIMNPVNETGFAFGTSFPYHYYSDYKTGNQKLDFLELPITAYEVGYQGDKTDCAMIEKALSLAKHYSLIMNFFYHPVYIAQYPACREAIDILLSMIKEQGINTLHSSPDTITQWWIDRSKISIDNIIVGDGKLRFQAHSPSNAAFVVKIALGSMDISDPVYPHKIIEAFGQRWLMLVMPGGDTDVVLDICG